MRAKWSVASGPDNSHLFDVAWFDTKRDAKEYISNLEVTPNGEPRPYKLYRYSYSPVNKVMDRVDRKEIEGRTLVDVSWIKKEGSITR